MNTIAATATATGEGGLNVIRISGIDTFAIVEKLFYKTKTREKRISLSNELSHTLHFGYIFENEKLIDEVVISIFKNPNSYTGEDVVEISSHGGNFIAQKILKILLNCGARHAEPGEFTKRAFLNGKIDLSQAEAVADLIKSKTESAHSSSIRQLEGSLSEFVNKTRHDIINITSLVELELDFAEEGLEFVKKDEIRSLIENLNNRLKSIIDTYITGKIIREGVYLVIAGKPNSGKSSLFNYFLKTNRSIVSKVAGTTRDYIEESVIINGVLFNLIDTAGLRMSDDEIESEGIRRSHKKIDEADLIVYLIDSSQGEKLTEDDLNYFNENFGGKRSIAVMSKKDLTKSNCLPELLKISLLEDETIEALKKIMTEKVINLETISASEEIILTNLRHKICLENVVKSLNDSVKTIDENLSGEFISVDLRTSLKYLGEITGEVTNDDILNNIFMNFCIGK